MIDASVPQLIVLSRTSKISAGEGILEPKGVALSPTEEGPPEGSGPILGPIPEAGNLEHDEGSSPSEDIHIIPENEGKAACRIP